MENGRIVEQGTHHDLLCHDGAYFNLYTMQFRAQEQAEGDMRSVA